MKNEKILEMLNNGEIEELKKVISEEIYNSSLDKTVMQNPDIKQ